MCKDAWVCTSWSGESSEFLPGLSAERWLWARVFNSFLSNSTSCICYCYCNSRYGAHQCLRLVWVRRYVFLMFPSYLYLGWLLIVVIRTSIIKTWKKEWKEKCEQPTMHLNIADEKQITFGSLISGKFGQNNSQQAEFQSLQLQCQFLKQRFMMQVVRWREKKRKKKSCLRALAWRLNWFAPYVDILYHSSVIPVCLQINTLPPKCYVLKHSNSDRIQIDAIIFAPILTSTVTLICTGISESVPHNNCDTRTDKIILVSHAVVVQVSLSSIY